MNEFWAKRLQTPRIYADFLYGREKMRLAFFQMRLAVGGDSPCFSKCASRILEKVKRILISVPDTGYNLFASSAISASSADEESNSAFLRRQYLQVKYLVSYSKSVRYANLCPIRIAYFHLFSFSDGNTRFSRSKYTI